MLKKIICLLLSILLIASLFSACGDKKDSKKDDTNEGQEQSTTEATGGSNGGTNSGANGGTNTTPNKSGPSGTVVSGVKYIGSVTAGSVYYASAGGYAYRNNNKLYGIASIDGSYNSGEIYYDVSRLSDYFVVQTKEYTDANNVDCVNCSGVVDAKGNFIVPAQYAMFRELDENYIRAYKATGITTETENCLMKLSQSAFSTSVQEGDVLYVGEWVVFDIRTGKEVPGVKGTTNATVNTMGDVLSYTENGQKFYKNAAGIDLPADARVFPDGSYIPSGETTVYGSDMQKRFEYVDGDFAPTTWEEGYYIMRKYDNGNAYALADKNGTICSQVYDNRISVIEGNLISVDGGIYDLNGTQVLAKDHYSSCYNNGTWLIQDTDKNVYLVTSDYQVTNICNTADGTYYMYRSYFTVTKTENKVVSYYSISKKTFVEGDPYVIGVAEKKIDDDNRDMIDMNTDATMLSNYDHYTASVGSDGTCVIYAYFYNRNADTCCDIFIKQ